MKSFCFLIILFSTVIIYSCSNPEVDKVAKLTALDTVHLHYSKLQYWMYYEHPRLGEINTFINSDTYDYIVLTEKGIVKFPIKPLMDLMQIKSNPDFSFVIDSSSCIVAFFDTSYKIYKINRKGELLKRIQFSDRRINKKFPILLYWKFLPITGFRSSSNQQFICNFSYFFKNFNMYQIDPQIRKKLFCGGCLVKLALNDSALIVNEELGAYPKKYLDKEISYYYYLPVDYAINKEDEIMCCFPSVDSILMIKNNNCKLIKAELPGFNKVAIFPSDKLMDYTYIRKYTCENTFIYNIFTWNDRFYIISTLPVEYTDGVDPVEIPWRLHAIGENFGLTDISVNYDNFSKHFLYANSKGLYFFNRRYSNERITVFTRFDFVK